MIIRIVGVLIVWIRLIILDSCLTYQINRHGRQTFPSSSFQFHVWGINMVEWPHWWKLSSWYVVWKEVICLSCPEPSYLELESVESCLFKVIYQSYNGSAAMEYIDQVFYIAPTISQRDQQTLVFLSTLQPYTKQQSAFWPDKFNVIFFLICTNT